MLENLRNSVAEVGETVLIEVSIIVDDANIKRPSISYYTATLLVPNVERQSTYDTLRRQVNMLIYRFLQSIENGNQAKLNRQAADAAESYANARKTFAAVCKLALTKSERALLLGDRQSMPVSEWPMYDRYATVRDAMEKAFRVNIEELNPQQYLAFARKVLHGELPSPEDHVDQSDLFRLLDQPPFTVAEYAELVASTLRTRVARLELTGESHSETWDDRYLIDQCLSYLGTMEGSHGVEALAWMIDYCLEHRYFDNRLNSSENSDASRKFSSFLEKAVRSLAEGAQSSEARAPAGFDFGRMQAWNNTLAAYPFTDHVAAQLRKYFTRLYAA